jgi:transcription initiation factor TFIIIB Brf1 subunit/transcription initiation factor TFIIB
MEAVAAEDFAADPANLGPVGPEEKAGPDVETPLIFNLRVYGCDAIQEATILLELPQTCAATAQVIFHRFYMRQSFRRYDARHGAIGALFLAAKVEENPRRIRDVVNVFDAMFQRQRTDASAPHVPIDIASQRYARMKELVVTMEREMLTELGFILYMEHPHKFILNYVKLICADPALEKPLAQSAWNVINDSLRTNLCLRFAPEVVCCAAISMAARALALPLPTQPPWWEVFEVGKEGTATCARGPETRTRPATLAARRTAASLPADTRSATLSPCRYRPRVRGHARALRAEQVGVLRHPTTHDRPGAREMGDMSAGPPGRAAARALQLQAEVGLLRATRQVIDGSVGRSRRSWVCGL